MKSQQNIFYAVPCLDFNSEFEYMGKLNRFAKD